MVYLGKVFWRTNQTFTLSSVPFAFTGLRTRLKQYVSLRDIAVEVPPLGVRAVVHNQMPKRFGSLVMGFLGV